MSRKMKTIILLAFCMIPVFYSFSHKLQPLQNKDDSATHKDFKGNYFMLGLGIGPSYGGAGMRVQLRRGGLMGYGAHLGVGYGSEKMGFIHETPFVCRGGVKFFPYKNLYVDLQYGNTAKIAYIDMNAGLYNKFEMGYGPSFMLGGDWVWGRKTAFGFNFGTGITYNIDNYNGSFITIHSDIGLLIRF